MSTELKTALASTRATIEFYSIGGEGLQKLGETLDSMSAGGPKDVPALLDKAKEALKKYLATFSGDAAPAKMYWCFPLATLRRSDPKVQDLQAVLARRERAAAGVVELQQIADNGLGLINPLKPSDPNYNKKQDELTIASHAAQQRAKDMLHFFRSTFVMSRGKFIQDAKNQVDKIQERRNSLREVITLAGGWTILGKTNIKPDWGGLTLYDEWQYWLAGVSEFPFVERARAAAEHPNEMQIGKPIPLKAL